MKKVIVAFVPVLHEGYRKFFEKHKDAETLYIFGPEISEQFYYLQKEIRALEPRLIREAILSWGINPNIEILDLKKLKEIGKQKLTVIMPREDVSQELAEKYLNNNEVIYDQIFLRWDRHNSIAEKPVTPNVKISRKAFDKKMMGLALEESEKSSDFWRHIGALVIKNGKIISLAHNRHVPSGHMPYVNGDPRNAFKKGLNLEISTGFHAEASLIADAARRGLKLEGAEMYVTTFPCPPCAKLIAYSGIKKLFCTETYGVLDGEDILKSKGVEITFVEIDEAPNKTEWKGYKK